MKIGEFTDAFERMALNESFNEKRSRRVNEGRKATKEDILRDIEWFEKIIENPNGIQARNQMLNLGPGADVVKSAQSHIRLLKRKLDAGDFRESFKRPVRKRINEAFDYDQAVAYIESKGIGCDPCQDIEGEHVCDLLDELGGGLGSEDYSKEELDRIVSSALEFKKDAETWDDDFEESLKEGYTVWFETPDGDADIAGTYKDRETAELVASDLDDSWIEETKNESSKLNEEGSTSKRVTQISIDLLWDPEAYPDYDPRYLMEDIESEIETSDIGMTILGYDFEDLTSTYIDQYPDLLESKQVLPIRKVLQGSDIMSIIDRNPREAIKKAVEIVSNSDEVSDKDKYEFKRNMQGNLNKAISTLATYFYDVNKAKI